MSLKIFSGKRFCLEWRTNLPGSTDCCESPSFSFYNSEWLLMLERKWNECKSEETWNIYLKKLFPSDDITTFVVTVYIKGENGKLDRIFDVSCFFSSPMSEQIFWFGKSLMSDEHPHILVNNEVTFFFTFDAPLRNMTDLKEDNETEKQSLESLSQNAEQLLLSKTYSDVSLKCGHQSFPAHRSILWTRSKVFATVLNEMSESKNEEMEIVDMQPGILQLFLRYLYTGKIGAKLTMDTAADLYEAAENYEVHSLKRECASFMEENLTESSLCSVLVLADKFKDLKMMDSAISFVVQRNEYFQSDIWNSFADWQPILAVKVYNEYSKSENKQKAEKED